ncbi:hypothetical protein ALC56_14129 [Trachymyrmex septentrionalis]|uniref:DNA-directed DNA polymerase n=1 Tax=Trachymyrmex septentrionalis TaxID=34720 RepID=A0A195ETQ4_9HYME|nr:hypothetical protein ALC56_14129 [Trachymyrmex septentrionalis]
MSFNSLDCITALNRELFSVPDIAKKLRCNCTKATAIINNVLNPLSIAELSIDLQNVSFVSVSTDASNHRSTKLFPIIIQYFIFEAISTIKDYFKSLEKPPVLIKKFFENNLSKAYSFIVHSTMHILYIRIEKFEKSNNFIIETKNIFAETSVISVRSMDNEYFAWSVISALYPAERHTDRESSYPDYTAVLNLASIEFPMTLKDISKFECGIDQRVRQVLPLRLTDDKKEKHANMLQDSRNNLGHFAWIKNLLRLVSSQITGKKNKKYFCDRHVDVLPITKEKYILFIKHVDQRAFVQLIEIVVILDVLQYLMYYNIQNGYILEVDLEYSQHLHNRHTDLFFCPTRDKPLDKREDKLLATLSTGCYNSLNFHGSVIELNTQFKTRAKNDFEKNLYKLMNNAIFGKTMDNERNHVDVKLITKWDGRYGVEAMIAKPNFHSRSIFAENLITVEMRKLAVKFNKPIYVGMCILNTSKVCLYKFHHEYMLPMYRDKCKIMYTDTDSLIYCVEYEDYIVYETMKRDSARFDTSDYPADNVYVVCFS